MSRDFCQPVQGSPLSRLASMVLWTATLLCLHFISNIGYEPIKAPPFTHTHTDPVTLSPVISTSSPTATSVTITWTQPEFSLPVVGYTVTVTRLNGVAETVRCTQYNDSRHTVTNTRRSALFTDLQEFSNYTVTVTAMFSMLIPASTNLELMTLSAGMR